MMARKLGHLATVRHATARELPCLPGMKPLLDRLLLRNGIVCWTLSLALFACHAPGDSSRDSSPPVPLDDLGTEERDLKASADLKPSVDLKSSPDLKSNPDLQPSPDQKAPPADLGAPADLAPAPLVDLAPSPIYRPLPSATANLRALDLGGNYYGHKLCIYGDDDEPLPYAVIVAPAGRNHEASVTPYTQVPAGVPLRVHVVENTWAFTLDCSRKSATPLSELITASPILSAGRYYSAVRTEAAVTTECLSHTTSTKCEFYPAPEGTPATTPCQGGAHYLLEDGSLSGGHYSPGYRVVNLTNNAAFVSYGAAPAANGSANQAPLPHFRQTKSTTYNPPLTEDLPILVCPWFLAACPQSTGWTADDGFDALYSCLNDWVTTFRWLGGIASSPRLLQPKATTIYLVGDAGRLSVDRSKLTKRVQAIPVADIADPLP